MLIAVADWLRANTRSRTMAMYLRITDTKTRLFTFQTLTILNHKLARLTAKQSTFDYTVSGLYLAKRGFFSQSNVTFVIQNVNV